MQNKLKKVWSMILVAAMMLSCLPGAVFSAQAQEADAEPVYEAGYTWAFDQTAALGKTKGLFSGDAAGTIQVMNHEGYNTLTPNRAIADGVLTTQVATTWGKTVGHGVFYQLPDALETGRIYQLSLNLYGGNEAAAMNGITVSFGEYTDTLTGDGGNIQKWISTDIEGMHNADAKITRSLSGNLPTEADNTVQIEFVATEAMAAGSWMLVSFPLTLNGSYKLGNVTMEVGNYADGYTWDFDRAVTLGSTKGLVSGDAAGTVKVMNHEGNNSLTPNRAIADGVLTTEVAAIWGNTVGHGVFYKLPAALEAGRIYQLSVNLYGGNEAAAMNGITVSFGEYTDTMTGDGGNIQQWQNGGITGLHNADTKITRSLSGNLPTAADNTVQIEFVATEAMANSGWMLVSFPLTLNGSYKLGSTSMRKVTTVEGYTWDFDKTVALGNQKGLIAGDAAGTVMIMNHEGNGNALTPDRAVANGVLTTEVVKNWNGTVGHGVFYKLPAALEVGKSYRLSVNLYGGNEAATMNGINVSFGDYTTVLTGDGGNIQQWTSSGIDGLHNADTKITRSLSGNLPTAADNTVAIEFKATEAMAAGSWMLVSFPLALSGSYKLGSVSIHELNYADGYTWQFNKTVAFTSADAYKVMQYGNDANTVGIISHSAYANYGTRSLSNGVLASKITATWAKGANGLYYKLPVDLSVGREYVLSMNLYASAEGTALVNDDSTSLKLSFVNEIPTEVTDKVDQYWTAKQIEGVHNAETLLTYRAPDYLSTDTANKVAISFVATQAMADNDGWMLVSMPLAVNGEVNLGSVTLAEKADTDNHFLNGDLSDGLTGWMMNHDSSYISAENAVLNVSDKVPAGDVKFYQAMYLDAGMYRLSFDVLGVPTSWRPVYFMGTALDNSSVTGSQLQVSKENGKTEGDWWTVTRDVTIETSGMYYFQMNLNQVSGEASVAPQMQYDNFELRKLETVTVTWKNDDGTVLEEDTVVVGTIPEYNGELPTKEADSHNSYTFIGWDQEITFVDTDMTYTAHYEVTTSEHNWGEGTETKAATCTEAGEMTYTCSVCGQTKTEAILPSGEHSYGDGVQTKAPTCAEDGEMTYTCSACGESYTEAIDATGEHSYDDAGVCTVCGESKTVVKTWNIVLGDNIGLNFVLALSENDEVQVQVDGAAVPVELTQNEDGTYQVLIEVAAAQMTSQIQLFVNGQAVEKTYSVREYADVILAGEYADSVKTLVSNMLAYGGAAQKYFEINENNYADRDITVAEVTVPGDDLSVAIADQLDGIDFYGASLVMRSKTAVRFYFKAESVEGLTFTVNGAEYDPVTGANGIYVEVADIDPQELADVLSMTVSDGVNTLAVSYSPVTYISRMYHKAETSEALKAVVKAMYGYYLAAQAYLANA